MKTSVDASRLVDRVAALVEAAKKAGADAADAVAVRGRSSSVSVRLGKVEATESSESDDISLRVFVGNRVASVSATAASDTAMLAERAVAMARVSPEDPYQGLADPSRIATTIRDLDLFDDTEIAAEQLKQDALAAEDAALSVKGVTNSGGSGASAGLGGLVLATSHGFLGQYLGSRFSRSASVIAGEGTAMERDYDFSSRLHFADLDKPEEIGRKAGERAVRRLNARQARTGPVTVIFDPRVARGIAGHIAGAINGAAVARKTSFLRDMMGKQIASAAVTVTDDPLQGARPGVAALRRRRGRGRAAGDGQGRCAAALVPVDLGGARARPRDQWTRRPFGNLGVAVIDQSGDRAGRPDAGAADQVACIGFYVTEVFGQGVNMVTGEYSRGASGFWIDNGEITYPVSEVTIASNMKDMFLNIVPANDVDRNFGTAAPTLLIEGMTLAGN